MLGVCTKVPPGADDWGDQLDSKTMEIAPSGMVVGVRATRRPLRHRPFDNVESTGEYSDGSNKPGRFPSCELLLGVLLCERRGLFSWPVRVRAKGSSTGSYARQAQIQAP